MQTPVRYAGLMNTIPLDCGDGGDRSFSLLPIAGDSSSSGIAAYVASDEVWYLLIRFVDTFSLVATMRALSSTGIEASTASVGTMKAVSELVTAGASFDKPGSGVAGTKISFNPSVDDRIANLFFAGSAGGMSGEKAGELGAEPSIEDASMASNISSQPA